MMWAKRKETGFTIVELLIVIVVIGILAAIVIVAFNGVQGRAKDTQRDSDLKSVQKALELYYIDNGGYPKCGATPGGTGPNSPPVNMSGLLEGCLEDDLIPKYIAELPKDPTSDGAQYEYRYAAGYKKRTTGTFGFDNGPTDNYILGTKHDTVSSPTYGGWGQSGLTLLLGSNR